jgi:hypothetical protein
LRDVGAKEELPAVVHAVIEEKASASGRAQNVTWVDQADVVLVAKNRETEKFLSPIPRFSGSPFQ